MAQRSTVLMHQAKAISASLLHMQRLFICLVCNKPAIAHGFGIVKSTFF